MKKILLGVAILSAMAYGTEPNFPAPSTTAPSMTATTLSDAGLAIEYGGVQITTTANVLSSGLIIASAVDSTSGMTSAIGLSHTGLTSTELANTSTIATEPSVFYIKRANNNERLGREGYDLTVALTHDGILKHETYGVVAGKDSTAKLNHSLGLTFTNNGNLNMTTQAGLNDITDTKTRKLITNHYVIEGAVTSTISASQTNALAGNYVNDALLTVTISKPN